MPGLVTGVFVVVGLVMVFCIALNVFAFTRGGGQLAKMLGGVIETGTGRAVRPVRQNGRASLAARQSDARQRLNQLRAKRAQLQKKQGKPAKRR